jgi:hypothetical protein
MAMENNRLTKNVEKPTVKALALRAEKEKAMNRELAFQNELGPLKMELQVSLEAT